MRTKLKVNVRTMLKFVSRRASIVYLAIMCVHSIFTSPNLLRRLKVPRVDAAHDHTGIKREGTLLDLEYVICQSSAFQSSRGSEGESKTWDISAILCKIR